MSEGVNGTSVLLVTGVSELFWTWLYQGPVTEYARVAMTLSSGGTSL